MRSLDSRIERIDDIERKLARRLDGWTTGELAREYGVDPSTIFRDLAMLESRGTGLVKHGRRYVLDHRRSIHNVKLNNDELLALYLAARLLSRHSDEHNPHVVKALDKLADALRARSPRMAQHVDQAATAVRERRVRREYVASLEVLTQGWAEGSKVCLRYRSYTKDETTERTFAPLSWLLITSGFISVLLLDMVDNSGIPLRPDSGPLSRRSRVADDPRSVQLTHACSS